MKRFLICILAFSFLLPTLHVGAAGSGNLLANLSFNDYVTNGQADDLSIGAKACYIDAYKPADKGLRFLLSKRASTITIPAKTKEDFVVSFDIMGQGDRFSGNLTLTDGSKTFIPLNFTDGNQITMHDKNQAGGFSFNAMTNVALVVKPSLSTIDIYIDGRSKVYDYLVRSINISSLDSLTFSFSSNNENASVILDNINVYEGNKIRKDLPVAAFNPEETELVLEKPTQEVGNTVFVNNDFSSKSTMSATQKSNSMKVVKEDDGNGCYQMEKLGTEDMFFDTAIDGTSYSRIVAEYALKLVDSGSSLTLMTLKSESAKWSNNVTVKNGAVFAGSTQVVALSAGKWTNLAFALNLSDETYDVYLEGEKVLEGVDYSTPFNGEPIVLMRTHIGSGEGICNILLDNYRVYEGTEPKDISNIKVDTSAMKTIFPSEEAQKRLMAGKVGLHLRSGILYANDEKTMLDPAPFVEDGRTLVPVRAISEAFGLDVGWEEKTQTVTIGNKATLVIDKPTMEVEGKQVALEVPAKVYNNRTFVPFRALCEDVLGKKVYYNDTTAYNSGMIVISDKEFTPPAAEKDLQALNDFLFYYRPTADEVLENYKSMGSENAHPRLFINQEGLAKLKQEIETYPVKKEWADTVIRVADGYVENNIKPAYGTYDGMRMSSTPAAKNYHFGMAYLLTGDKKYVDAAWVQMEEICSWQDWNPNHYLDTSEMSAGVAVGYDWMYDAWTPEQRKHIEEGIYRNGLAESELWQYGAKGSPTRWSMANNNWNLVCNGSITIAALGLMDVYPDLCSRLIQNTYRGTESMMFHFAPDGAWFEGPGYWSYTLQYVSRMMAASDGVLGTCYRLSECEGLNTTADFILHMQSNIGSYNFADADVGKVYPESLYWLSNKYENPAVAAATLNQTDSSSSSPLALIWLDPEISAGNIELPLDAHFRDTEAVAMRDSWTDKNATYVAYHGGESVREHSHLDQGSFIFESGGERWAIDMGKENYNLPGYWGTAGPRWQIFRMRAASHNTIVINPDITGIDHNLDSFATVQKLESKPRGAISTVDMSEVLKDNAKSAKRGFFLTDYRKSLVVRDEMDLPTSSEIYWFMYTRAEKADIKGKNVVLTSSDGKQLKVDFACNKDMQVIFEDAKALPNTPSLDGENPNAGIKRLMLKINGSGKVNITAKLTPVGIPDTDVSEYDMDMEKWTIPDGEIPAVPRLDMIYMNGEPLEGFNPDTTSYAIKYVEGDTNIPQFTASSDQYKLEITQAGSFNQPAAIKVISAEDERWFTTYNIGFKMIPKPVDLEGFNTLAVRDITAVDEPQPENPIVAAIDNDFNTRWSAQGMKDVWIQVDLGSVQKVDTLLMATYNGNARCLYFKILLSKDGTNFEEVYDGQTSGQTNDLEQYDLGGKEARYVRVSCYGTSSGDWNSITELIVAQKK